MDSLQIQGFRLSPQQEHLWHLLEAGFGDGAWGYGAVLVEGCVDGRRLAAALAGVVRRHEILRTAFRIVPGMAVPLQTILDPEKVDLPQIDLTGLPEPAAELEVLQRRLAAERPELDGLQVCRIILTPRRSCLVLRLSALCSDATGLENLVREIARSYAVCLDAAAPQEDAIQYVDVSDIFNELREAGPESGRGPSWQGAGPARPPAPHLGLNGRPKGSSQFRPGCVERALDPGVAAGLAAMVGGASDSMPLLACWHVLLWRLLEQQEAVVGVAFDGRTYDGLTEALGLFARHLPIRIPLEDSLPFRLLVERLRKILESAAEWQDYLLWEERSAFPSFAFETEPRLAVHRAGEVSFRTERRRVHWDRFEIKLSCAPAEGSWTVGFHYDANVLARRDAESLADRFLSLAASAASGPELALADLEILGAAERQELLVALNDTRIDGLAGRCLHELFEEQARRSPDAVAVAFRDACCTYGKLDDRAERLACHLRGLGVGSEVRVALGVERSLDMVLGILGILKAGGAWVPLDPDYPRGRLAFLLEDSRAPLLLTQERLRGNFPATRARVVSLDGDWAEIATHPKRGISPWAVATPENLAYLIYTSGSTGQPKGVMVTHAAIANRLLWMQRVFPLSAGDRVLQKTPYSFDASIWEVFVPLFAGAGLELAEPGGHRDDSYLLETVERHGITVLQLVPSQLATFLGQPAVRSGCRSLRRVFCGGEALPGDVVERFFAALAADLCNLYGPTETAIDATFHTCLPGAGRSTAPIGIPLDNVRVYLLSPRQRPVPPGSPGELYVGGAGLARGYFGRPDLTAERFVPDPFTADPGGRLYRTGDLARHLPGGEIEFLGRADHQVKLRGFRIELGEIESLLRQCPGLREAAVAVKEIGPGDQRMVGYVVPQGPTEPGRQLRQLPNGLAVAFLNASETDSLYREIFEESSYLTHGVDVRNGDCVFDVGANIGLFTLFLALSYRDLKLYAFEPIPTTFEVLRTNVALYGLDAKLFEHGLADRAGSAAFTFYPRWSAMSGAYADESEEEEVNRIVTANRSLGAEAGDLALDLFREKQVFVCELRTLSDVIREQGVEHIDLLKVDVEKSELDVLHGLAEDDWEKIGQIILEAHDVDGRLAELRELLERHGYRVTVDQDPVLAGTGLYNLYAVHPKQAERRRVAHPAAAASAPPRLQPTALGAEPDALARFLAEHLPGHMVPSIFVKLDRLPRLPNGKLDRAALPHPEEVRPGPGSAPAAPRNPTEELLAGLWADLLRQPQVGIEDDFFELGGHSLLATQLVSRIREIFRVPLKVGDLFRAPTVAGVAEIVAAARHSGDEAPPAIQPVPRDGREGALPLSFSQQRLWFLDQLEPGTPAYNLPVAVRLLGPLNVPALARGMTEVVRRHESLRTTFAATPEGPVQVVSPAEPVPVPLVDLSGLGERAQAEALALVKKEAWRPFDLARGPLFRLLLLGLDGRDHVVLKTVHHIVSDGWSLNVLLKELTALYEAGCTGKPAQLPALPVQYADYAYWQRQWLAGDVLATEVEHWRRRLDGLPDRLELPTDRPRPPVRGSSGFTRSFTLPAGLAEALRRLVRSESATLFMVVLGAFQALLARLSGQSDVAVGTPIAGRNRLEIEGLIGFFVNTLVLRAELADDPSFRTLIERTRLETLEAYAHQDLPFEKLVDEIAPQRSLSHTPLFQVMFMLENAPVERSLRLSGLTPASFPFGGSAAKFDLTLVMIETALGLSGTLESSADLFEVPTSLRLLRQLEELLAGAVSQPDAPLSELPLLGAAERQQILLEWNDTAGTGPTGLCIHELFARQVERTPDAPAVVQGGVELTFRQLERRANQLAHHLRAWGAGPGTLVGVYLGRSPEMVVAVLGVLKAGAAYVPLDPSYPEARIAWILSALEIRCLLTESCYGAVVERLAEETRLSEIVWMDETRSSLDLLPEDAPESGAGPGDLAYIIFTSGTTGTPKGVMVRHQPVVNLIEWVNRTFEVGGSDRILFLTSLCFDLSVYDIFGILAAGGSIRVATEEETSDPERLLRALREEPITFWDSAPAALQQLVPFLTGRGGPLRLVFLSGDWIPVTLPDQVRRTFPQAQVIALGGATEATVWSNFFPVGAVDPGWASIPYGRPIREALYHVLDARLEPCPVLVPGDLYIGGDCLTTGYIHEPALTADKYVPDPFGVRPGARLYRTGDRARYLADGNLEFLGRLDPQVKIRGFRVELGEIEAVLGTHPEVREAVAAVRTLENDRRLVAYVVPAHGQMPSAQELREHLRERLPEYMVPSLFVPLEALPLTANRKVDRRALPEPDPAERLPDEGLAPPRNPWEELLAELWSKLLGTGSIGIHDNFFELGGHSLLATQLVSWVRETFGVELPVRSIFETPTIAGLAADLSRGVGRAELPPIGAASRQGDLPLSFSQQRLWFLDQLAPGNPAYNIAVAVRLQGNLSVAGLQAALSEAVRRHEALRTTFAITPEGEPVQVIAAPGTVPLPVVDLRFLADARRRAEADRLMRAEALRPFALNRGPLLHVLLTQLCEEEIVLHLTLHHIVGDGWSMGVLVRELTALYEAFSQGRPSPLAELEIQYADFAAWQRQWLSGEVLAEHLAYWRGRLGDAPPALLLPADHRRPPIRTFAGGSRPLRLPGELAEAIRKLARNQGATLFMTLFASFQALLARYTDQMDLTVGTPIAGRNHLRTEDLIGLFVNTLVLRAELAGDPRGVDLVAQARERLLEAYAHQDLPFDRLVEELQPERDLGRTPLFQVMFALQNAPVGALSVPGLDLQPLPTEGGPAKFDLDVALAEVGDDLAGLISYDRDLFDGTTLLRMAVHFEALLRGLAEDPQRRLSDLPLLTPPELRQLDAEWNDTAREVSRDRFVHDLFMDRARAAPGIVAVVCEGEAVTYGELNRRSNQVARWLRRREVGPGVLVGLSMDRSIDLVVGLLAILKAGGAYVPLDPGLPADRLAFLVEDARISTLLTAGALDLDRDAIARESEEDLESGATPESLAYVIYTSGSTGRPKGVLAEHGGLLHVLSAVREAFGWSSGDVMACLAPASFDIFLFELLSPLLVGGVCHLIPLRPTLDVQRLLDLLPDLTRLHAVPAVMRQIVDAAREAGRTYPRLRTLFVGGDRVPPELLAAMRDVFPGAELRVLYGPTEGTILCSSWAVPAGAIEDRLSIGRALGNVELRICDRHGNTVPIGVPGEIWIGGAGVTRGYLRRDDLTDQRYPRRDGRRFYRTGDLARRLADGTIEFLGRADQQVKIRGFRIELEEIEAVLGEHPQVRAAAVLVQEDPAGDPRLVAFIAPEGAGVSAADLRAFLQGRLPDYMVPSALVLLESLPLTPHGKVDRRALFRRASAVEPWELVPPAARRAATPMEELLAAIFAEVLGLDQVGPEASFFALGGHSLSATRLASRVRERLGRDLPVREIFETPTVAGLAAVLLRDGLSPSSVPPLTAVWRGAPLPLSFAQQRLWFLDRLLPGSAAYNVPIAVLLRGAVDRGAFAAALGEVVRRHETLRTTFTMAAGEPVQVIAPVAAAPLPCVDLRALPEPARRWESRRLVRREAQSPFDLARGPLLRSLLVALDGEESLVLLTMHHIVSDGWSMGVLVRELVALYDAFHRGLPSPLAELEIQYGDFACWQRSRFAGDALAAELAYWRDRLQDAQPVLELPFDRPRPAVQDFRAGEALLHLSRNLVAGLRLLSTKLGTTMFMSLLGAFQALLSSAASQQDVTVGTPFAGRDDVRTEGLIGFFVNTLALRTDLRGEPGFSALAQRVREVVLGAHAHQALPFEKLVEELRPERSLSRTPLFQVMFALQNAPVEPAQVPGLHLEPFETSSGVAKFDLTLVANETADGLVARAEYSRELFDATTIGRLLHHFQALLEAAVAAPAAPLSTLSLLSEGERHQLLLEWNDAATGPVAEPCLHRWFEAQAERAPQAVAAVYGKRSLSYGELNAWANRLARHLRRLGVGPDRPVAICLDRSLEMVVGMLAVLKAGGAYVPLDPHYPRERHAFILADALGHQDTSVLLTRQVLSVLFQGEGSLLPAMTQVVCLDADGPEIDRQDGANLDIELPLDSLAYVIYTSGSTGRPKGVLVSHANVVRLFSRTDSWFGFGEGDVWSLLHSYAFDFSVWEMWGALLYGGRLVVVPHEVSRSPEGFYKLLVRERVTVVNQTPSVFRQVVQVDAAQRGELAVRLVIFGGEALDVSLLDPWWQIHGEQSPQLVNMYGITETTVHVTYRPLHLSDLGQAHQSPVGRALPDLRLHVLDRELSPVPAGAPGEIFVGGAGLARGYLARPELTAERFIPDPFAGLSEAPGARLYRTGDLARRLATGDLVFLGRSDHQVKIRGFRIELGEIEAALGQHPGVREAVLVAPAGTGGERRLVAYVVPARDGVERDELRAFLRSRLPEFMVPSLLSLVDELPRLPNGKVDRSGLTRRAEQGEAKPAAHSQGEISLQTPAQELLAGIFCELLEVASAGARDGFFELGGHSLLATRLLSRVQEIFGVELPVSAVFETPLLEDLAGEIEAALGSGLNVQMQLIPPVLRGEGLPLSFAQQRLWFFDQMHPGSSTYNIPMAVRLVGPLDLPAFTAALDEIVRRHESLRTMFASTAGEPLQMIAPFRPLPLPLVDLRALPEPVRRRESVRLSREEARRPFDLASGPLLRILLLIPGAGEHLVLLSMHHIVSDGWSMELLSRELKTLYGAFSSDDRPALPELPIQYADFAAWQRSWLTGEVLEAELAYWRSKLGEEPPALELPADRPRPALPTFAGGRRAFRLAGEPVADLRRLSRERGATLFMTLLAVFQALLARYSGQEDFAVGVPIAGRRHPQTENLIGFFVNTLALRADVAGDPDLDELLRRVRETAIGAYAHQDLPFEKLVAELQPTRDLGRSPLFQVVFALQNTPVGSLALPGLSFAPVEVEGNSARVDLTLSLLDAGGALNGSCEYSSDLFDAATSARMAAHFETLLLTWAAAPQRRLLDIPLLSPTERAQALEWSGAEPVPVPCLVHEMFEEWARRTPQAAALVFEEDIWTYAEVSHRAERLASHLTALGIGPETRVALCVEPSPEMIVALLAVLKAGGAYVPLDPTYPSERLAYMLADARPAVLLTQERLRSALPPSPAWCLCLDAPEEAAVWQPAASRGGATAGSAAYVIYTSGSTGVPKGVVALHRGLAGFARSMADRLELGPGDRVLQFASLSFDASAVQIFPALASGAAVVLHRNPRALSPGELVNLCIRTGVTILDLPAALWRQWVREVSKSPAAAAAPVRMYLTGGEAVPTSVLRDWAQGMLPGTGFLSSYGPTEATVTTTVFQTTCGAAGRIGLPEIPIGRPLGNARVYVLDARLESLPPGVAGEIFIGGEGVTRGYLHLPAETAERYIPDPWSPEPGARLYRTGDLARRLPDGMLQFLGRRDQQVKLRGHRVELEEIEAALAALPGVREAVVVIREDLPATATGDRRLVAYLVGDASADALRQALRQRLPDYMVPAAFVMLAVLPLTPSGKVDRKALPAPERTHTATGVYTPPRNALEHAIAGIWQEVLGLDRVGREDNFFDAGGHSLLMIQVHARLRERLGRDLTVVELFQYPTVQALAEHLAGDEERVALPAVAAPPAPLERPTAGFAVIGMAGRFPGAAGVEELWANLRDGREAVVPFTDEEMQAAGVRPELLADPRYVKSGTVLEGIELFDAEFFGFSPREAEMMDPQHRLFLEASWQAVEDAGYSPRNVPGRVGVWGGADMSTYMFRLLARPDLLQDAGLWAAGHGVGMDFLATRVSYELNLRGPSVAVQTACSTSLVAVHHACRSLASGECDMALAGGVCVNASQRAGYLYEEGSISSPDGHCRAFDAKARGTISGNGVGVVVLKRLEDALRDGDTIRAVIRGTAINNDGSLKVGYTAPSVEGQAEVIAAAQAAAGVSPDSIGYVEAHGTGTSLGDPIEVTALARAFHRSGMETERQGFCGLGSIKTNIGHLGSAAGVAGLIKTVLALEHRQIPPSLHFEAPNPAIDFAKSPFRVVSRLTDWEADGGPRRAGVSSFGIGGTNAHAVLEEATPAEPSGSSRPYQLLPLSARTAGALEEATDNLAAWLERHPEAPLADVAYTLQVGRTRFDHRRVLVCRDREDALQAFGSRDPQRLLTLVQEPVRRRVVFLFPGGGAQYAGMGLDLYRQEPVFRAEVDRCLELLVPHLGLDLKPYLYPSLVEGADGGALSRTSTALPALFVTEIALAKLWMSWGLLPQALIGHSLGEYAAAYLSGVLSLEDALAVVALRGRLFETLPEGAMLSVPLPEAEVLPLLATGLSIAAINDAAQCVVSGPVEEIVRLEQELAGRALEVHRLHIDVAAHSSLVEPILGEFGKLLRSLRLQPPRIPFISDVTGTWIREEEATDPGYWVRQLRHTVRFAAGLDTLLEEPQQVFLEMGPGRILSSFVRRHPRKAAGHQILTTLRHVKDQVSDLEFTFSLLGRLWLAGVEIDWQAFQGEEKRRRVPLPTYPFQRRRFWVEAPHQGLATGGAAVDRRRFTVLGGGEPVRPAADFSSLLRDPQNAEVLQRLLEAEPDLRVLLPVPQETGAASENGASAAPARPAAGHQRPDLATPYCEPRNEVERRLATVWGNLLGIGQVGVHDDFFELGGHSVLATRLLSRVREELGFEIPLGTIFAEPTVARLAAHLAAGGEPPAIEAEQILPAPRTGALPLSYAQQRLWFVHQLDPDSPVYNLQCVLRVEGPLRAAVLARTLGEIVRRHEALRTVFVASEGSPVQVIQPAAPFALPLVDLASLPASRREAELLLLAGEETARPFDLTRGPMLRGLLLRLAEEDHVLALTTHHIASDGWALGILISEVKALYPAFLEGKPSPLPELPLQYADFAVWQRGWLDREALEQLMEHWRRRLAGAPLQLDLPGARPRPGVLSPRGAARQRRFSAPLTEQLSAFGRGESATLFMLLLASLQALLHARSGAADLLVGTDVAGRDRREIEGLIGFFINQLPLRSRLAGDPTLRELLGQVRETALEAYAHQDLPFDLLVEALRVEQSRRRSPVFQVKLVLQNIPREDIDLPGLSFRPVVRPGAATAQLDLHWSFLESNDEIWLTLTYSTDLYDEPLIESLLDEYEMWLHAFAERPEARFGAVAAELARAGQDRLAERGLELKSKNLDKLRSRRRQVQVEEELVGAEHGRAD